MSDMKWIRYRFLTRSVEDPRPLIHDKRYPWWWTGTAGDESSASIVVYLPVGEPLDRYWDDAFEIDQVECAGPTYSDRFPKPEWLVESA